MKKIRSNPRAFYSYVKWFSKLNTGIGPFYDADDGSLINDEFKQAETLRMKYENVFSDQITI